jgi:two-component system sensor histidine kinase/response regulator
MTATQIKQKIRVRFWDQMVLIGFGLALFYSVFDSVLYIFTEYNVDFFQRLFGPDLSEVWSRLTILCLFIIFGSHAQYAVNQRKIAEAALRSSEERYRRIVETTPDGYYEVDVSGNYTFFNDAMCDLLGYSRAEMTGMNHRAYLDEENSQKLLNAINQVYRTGESIKALEFTFTRRDGSVRQAESSISLITDSKGQPTGFGGFLRDSTERKQAEALRQAKMAAETASREKSRFLANMSHEIRTPLNSIIGLIELMLETDLRPDQREDLDVVISSAYALLSLINNLLDFSKIEAGKFELESAPFHLRDFMKETLRMMAMRTQTKGIELGYRVAPEAPDRLVGDPDRLRQILLNLIENAVKFTDEGEVIVYVDLDDLDDSEADLHFSVEDTGIGIPKEQQKNIFSAFRQADTKTASRYGGTGLGLAVSSQLVKLMGGELRVSSQTGKGSRFEFGGAFKRLTQEPRVAKQADYSFQGMKILVVDDNATIRRLTKEMLEEWQMEVKFASNVEEARQVLSASDPQNKSVELVLIDSDMPGSDGFTLARWIKDQKLEHLRLIMMLTFPYLKHKAEFKQLGVRASVIKPFNPAELFDAIQIAMDKKKPAEQQPQKVAEAKPKAAVRSLKILVAEDTPFNQTFILRLLEKNGYQAVLVENGQQAVEMFNPDTIDIILMDVQMPEMDGFKATGKIREIEEQKGGHIPIIAMTAYATEGDRERCLAAGMDDYVSKPISAVKLFKAIEALMPAEKLAEGAAKDAAKATDGQEGTLLDKDNLIQSFENDSSLFKELVEIFVNDYPQMLSTLRTSLKALDAQTFSRTAHSLKGMLRNFQAQAAADTAFDLEKKGKQGELDGTDEIVEKLADQLGEVAQKLKQLVKEIPGSS